MDERLLELFKKTAQNFYVIMVNDDYGAIGLERLMLLTDTITKVYRHLNFLSFSKIVIYTAFDNELYLEKFSDANPIKYNSIHNMSEITGNVLTIEIRENTEIFVASEFIPDIDSIRLNGIVYIWDKKQEFILGKKEERPLLRNIYSDSWFANPTHKDLELALEDYKVRFAKMSNCPYLKGAWFNEERIYFRASPEDSLRDSLHFYLFGQLRDAEVRPEQNMGITNPVDIKITWTYTNRLAVIEIKWLGKSLNLAGDQITQNYTQSRALEGADQLKGYLDINRGYAPDKITIGYLVVFDGRRRRTDPIVTNISRENAEHYKNIEIDYDPDYSKERDDFAKPVRFFMDAKYAVK